MCLRRRKGGEGGRRGGDFLVWWRWSYLEDGRRVFEFFWFCNEYDEQPVKSPTPMQKNLRREELQLDQYWVQPAANIFL